MRILVPCFVLLAAAAAERPTVCGSSPSRVYEALHLNRESRGLAALAPVSPPRADVGDIAILESSGGVLGARNDFDLANRTVTFQPAGSRYRYSSGLASYNAALESGVALPLRDDDTLEVALPFSFPFFGVQYSRVFVNSDGNFTFGAGDGSSNSRTLGRLTSGPPRIAGLFRDLDPGRSGRIVAVSTTFEFAVTWVAVPDFRDSGVGPLQTFQIRLYPDGRIAVAFERVNTDQAVVGISPGGSPASVNVVSLDGAGEAEGVIAERFERLPELDIVRAAQRFYENHGDAYDYLVFFNSLGVSAGSNILAFQVPVRVPGTGYGLAREDFGREFGSPRRLQSVINMGPLTRYPEDPNAPVSGRITAGDTTLTVLAHEAGHQYLAFANLPGLLGRQRAHWSFFFNSDASLLEGNRILDNGEGASPRFFTVQPTQAFSALDSYLAGWQPLSAVPPSFYIRPSNFAWRAEDAPQAGAILAGERVNVDPREIAAGLGRRTPDNTVAQRRYRFAFVLIVPAGQSAAPADIARIDNYRRQFVDFFSRASRGEASADASLRRAVQWSSAPAAGVLAGQIGAASIQVDRAADADLTFRVDGGGAFADLPTEVRIPGGARQVEFQVRGRTPGVERVRLVPSDPAYEELEARLQVLPPEEAQVSVTVEGGVAAVRVTDVNRLPYAGVPIRATVVGDSVVNPAESLTDADGVVRFEWLPGAGDATFTIAGGQSVTLPGRPVIGQVLNSASLDGRLTPGALTSIYGAGFSGGSVRVETDGSPASVVRVGSGEVATVLGAGSTRLRVVNERGVSNEVSVSLRDRAPAVFVDGASGLGAVVSDGRVGRVSAGAVAEVYATGIRDGDSITVRVGPAPAEVLFAGRSSVFAGMWQINIRVPEIGTAGEQLVVLNSGGEDSPAVRVVVER
jgi:uncharacterized protein (TIGR03437 family)